jgi:hypothetical protein
MRARSSRTHVLTQLGCEATHRPHKTTFYGHGWIVGTFEPTMYGYHNVNPNCNLSDSLLT